MTIIQLEYLLAVANYGSFSLAAEKCFVTQPSLSMQVKNLEEELGVIVLDRSKKPVLPTDAGLAVIRQAKEAVQAFAMVREVVSDLQNEISGTLGSFRRSLLIYCTVSFRISSANARRSNCRSGK